MSGKKISERLRALATDDSNKSKSARLREVYDDVEAALRAGVPRSKVVEELAALGLELTLSTFDTTLQRLRRKKRGEAKNPPEGRLETTPAPSPSPKPEAPKASHDPTALDAIINSKPDLAGLSKLAKKGNKK